MADTHKDYVEILLLSLKDMLKHNNIDETDALKYNYNEEYPTVNFHYIVPSNDKKLKDLAFHYMQKRETFYNQSHGGKKRTRRGKSRSRKSRNSRKKKRTKKRRT